MRLTLHERAHYPLVAPLAATRWAFPARYVENHVIPVRPLQHNALVRIARQRFLRCKYREVVRALTRAAHVPLRSRRSQTLGTALEGLPKYHLGSGPIGPKKSRCGVSCAHNIKSPLRGRCTTVTG